MREFAPPSLAHRVVERRTEIAEERKWSPGRPFFTHKQQRNLRRQQHDCDRGMHERLRRDRCNARAEWRVADLIMVLQKRHEGARRQMIRRLAAPMAGAMLRGLALIGKPGCERAAEMLDRAFRVIAVIAPVLAR